MYQVFKNKRVMKSINNTNANGFFATYEEARQALRKYIRKLVAQGKAGRAYFAGNVEWDGTSRNPVNFTNEGFAIRRVA
jgi:hypothetical protein